MTIKQKPTGNSFIKNNFLVISKPREQINTKGEESQLLMLFIQTKFIQCDGWEAWQL